MSEHEPNRDQAANWNASSGDTWVEMQPLLDSMMENIAALLIEPDGTRRQVALRLPLSASERPIVLAGCLINHYAVSQE